MLNLLIYLVVCPIKVFVWEMCIDSAHTQTRGSVSLSHTNTHRHRHHTYTTTIISFIANTSPCEMPGQMWPAGLEFNTCALEEPLTSPYQHLIKCEQTNIKFLLHTWKESPEP